MRECLFYQFLSYVALCLPTKTVEDPLNFLELKPPAKALLHSSCMTTDGQVICPYSFQVIHSTSCLLARDWIPSRSMVVHPTTSRKHVLLLLQIDRVQIQSMQSIWNGNILFQNLGAWSLSETKLGRVYTITGAYSWMMMVTKGRLFKNIVIYKM